MMIIGCVVNFIDYLNEIQFVVTEIINNKHDNHLSSIILYSAYKLLKLI